MLATSAALLVAGAIGCGVALGTGVLPPFDVHLALDGRQALVFHNGLPEPPTQVYPVRQMRRAFQIIYSTPRDDWVLVTIPEPEH